MPANLVPDAARAPRGERNDRSCHYPDDEAGIVLPCVPVWRHWSIMAATLPQYGRYVRAYGLGADGVFIALL